MGEIFFMLTHSKKEEEETMQTNKNTKKKGGRPKREAPRNLLLGVRCSSDEKKKIVANSRLLSLTVSEYLRELGLAYYIQPQYKILPKEVLLFNADLNHIGSNLNQIAKKRNGIDPLSDQDKAELLSLKDKLSQLVSFIKSYFE